MPSSAHMSGSLEVAAVQKDELVWLTYSAIIGRIEILTHTHPIFNERPSIAQGQFEMTQTGIKSFKANIRKGVAPQKVIDIFEEAGYNFIEDEKRIVSMLVDATIPAFQNTNGRFQSAYIGEKINRSRGVLYEGSAILPQDEGKLGFRPISKGSAHCIAIPVDIIIQMHQKAASIETMYLTDDQASPTTQHLFYEGSWVKNQVARELVEYFKIMANDSEIGHIVKDIGNFSFYDDNRQNKEKLFDLIQKLSIKMYIFGRGYFPYEPIILLSVLGSDEYEITKNFLIDSSRNSKWPNSAEFMLQEILLLMWQAVRYIKDREN